MTDIVDEGSVREPVTHDFGPGKCMWGHNVEILRYVDNGQALDAFVFSAKGLRVNDYLILKNGVGSTRYQVKEVKNKLDPPDMWVVKMEFAPREAP